MIGLNIGSHRQPLPDGVRPGTPEAVAWQILRIPRGEKGSGLVSIDLSKVTPLLRYRVYPAHINSVERAIGFQVAPKLRELYATEPSFQTLHWEILLPYENENDQLIWKDAVKFSTDRRLLDTIKNKHYDDGIFLKSVEDFVQMFGADQ